METLNLQASQNVDRTEDGVTSTLSGSELKCENLEPALAKFRSACQDFIFIDFGAATEKQVEARLWSAHSKVNSKLREHLAEFRKDEGLKKKVERRKAEKNYLTFIKSSQAYYRGFIQRLASAFTDIPEIVSVARGMDLDTLSADPPSSHNPNQKEQLINSCYSALVQLGDLSRYRESELKTTRRNWGPAVGYYNKAAILNPSDGRAYNQLAVIAFTDRDHLRAIYHLYQAICVEIPFPRAKDNLELDLRKLRLKLQQGKPITENTDVFEGSGYLYERFLLFHARCWTENSPGLEQDRAEILQLIASEIREQPEATILRKLSLINIAAEKVNSDASAIHSFKRFQSFNVDVFSLLLKILIDGLSQASDDTGNAANSSIASIAPVVRRVLSHLRLYSGWLLSTVSLLLANGDLSFQMRQLWELYAAALNLLLKLFRVKFTNIEIPYLLKEDEETLGFSAFSEFVRTKRFYVPSGQLKPVASDSRLGPRDPEKEMLFRIKEIVKDGMLLIRDGFASLPVPLAFSNLQFVCLESSDRTRIGEGAASQAARPISAHRTDTSIENPKNVAGRVADENVPSAETSMASRMENMVNDLTRPAAARPLSNIQGGAYAPTRTETRTPVSPEFVERRISGSQSTNINARDLVQRMQQSPGALRSSPKGQAINIAPLPSILNTPFAPRPGETPESPRLRNAHRLMQSPSSVPHYTSSAEFTANLMRMQDQVQMRTSPQSSFQPTMSSNYHDAPSSLPWGRLHDQTAPQSSPWRSPLSSGMSVQPNVTPARPQDPSPYGAIGESRPKSSRTPNSSHPG